MRVANFVIEVTENDDAVYYHVQERTTSKRAFDSAQEYKQSPEVKNTRVFKEVQEKVVLENNEGV